MFISSTLTTSPIHLSLKGWENVRAVISLEHVLISGTFFGAVSRSSKAGQRMTPLLLSIFIFWPRVPRPNETARPDVEEEDWHEWSAAEVEVESSQTKTQL